MTMTKPATRALHQPKPLPAYLPEDDVEGTASRSNARRRDRIRRMRRAGAMAVLPTLAVLALAACGGGDEPSDTAKPAASRSSTASDGVAFAQCMRENGLPNFQDPQPGKGMGEGVDVNSEAFKKAMDACRDTMPAPDQAAGGGQQQWSESDKLKYAQCMRENGVPNFPDPDPNGGFRIPDGADPNTPQFKTAEEACAEHQPEGLRNQAPNRQGGGS